MATLTLQSLDDKTYAQLEARARRNQRSVDAEVCSILESQVEEADARAARMRELREQIKAKRGVQTDSVSLIRSIRDET